MRRKEERGFLLLFAFVLMTALVVIAGSFLYLVAYETRGVSGQSEDLKLLNLADAGVERAMRAIGDDYQTTTQTGTADLRGATTSGTAGTAAQMNFIRYTGDGSNLTINASAGTNVVLQDFDQNHLGTRITNVSIGCRYRKSSGGGVTPRLEILYTTNGVFPQVGNSSLDVLASATSFNAAPYVVLGITADRAWTWSVINSGNFRIRARAYGSSDRNIDIDYLFLRVTYEIDTKTESWYTGTFEAFPKSLGAGAIQSVTISDEQAKVHLNTAPQSLLRYLMEEHGVLSATANTVATNIVTYRAGNSFDSIEEVKQVTGMTTAIYDAIKTDITVYSRINTTAQGPAGSRAPVNINTASREVLEAILDPLTFSSPSDITNLVDAIIAQRNTAPFTCFYTSDGADLRSFYNLERSVGAVSNAEDDRVLGNADASLLSPTREGGTVENALTTEFCYDSSVFKVESLAQLSGRRLRVTTILGDQGARTFTTAAGDATSTGYRRENFE